MNTKGNKDSNQYSYRLYNKSLLLDKNPSNRSDFYYFTDWILNFHFYEKLADDNDKNTYLITRLNGPNDDSILKIIKAMDQLEDKDWHEFTVYSLTQRTTNYKSNNNNNTNINYIRINNNYNNYNYNLNSNNNNDENLSPLNSNNNNNNNNINNNNINNLNNNFNNITFNNNKTIDLKTTIQLLFDRLCHTKLKKVEKLLINGPPNIIKYKYSKIHYKIGISLEQLYNLLLKEEIYNENIKNQINIDSLRTLNYIKYFKQNYWKQKLYNILKCIIKLW